MELTKLHSSIFITKLVECEMLNKFKYFEWCRFVNYPLYIREYGQFIDTSYCAQCTHYKTFCLHFQLWSKVFSQLLFSSILFNTEEKSNCLTNIPRTDCFELLYYEIYNQICDLQIAMHHFRRVKIKSWWKESRKSVATLAKALNRYKCKVFI